VVVLGVIATVGIRESKWVTNVLALITVFVIVAGICFLKAANLTPFISPSEPDKGSSGGLSQPRWQVVTRAEPTAYGVTGILVATAVVFFAYSGFEAVANLGEETENPGKDMPPGLIGTLVICTILYLLVCVVLTGHGVLPGPLRRRADLGRVHPGRAGLGQQSSSASRPWPA
jgi:basic amino acid/polyamine antiporter, APA family